MRQPSRGSGAFLDEAIRAAIKMTRCRRRGRVPRFIAGSVTTVTTRWLDDGEGFEVEIDDLLQGRCGGTVAEAVGQGVGPGGIFGLQGEQFGDGSAPAPWSAAAVCRWAGDRGGRLAWLLAGAIAGLAFRVGHGCFTDRFTGHDFHSEA